RSGAGDRALGREGLPESIREATSLAALELVCEFGKYLEQITNEAVIGDLKDRRLLVLVDGHNDFRVFHSGEMLNGAGNSDRDVECRCDDLAGLPDLIVVGNNPRIDGRAGGAYRRSELIGHLLQEMEIVAGLHSAAARDDNARAGQFGALRLRQLGTEEL